MDASSPNDHPLHRFVFEHALEPVVVLAESGRVVTANHAARELAGVSIERLFGAEGAWSPTIASFLADVRARGRGAIEITIPTSRGAPRHLALDGTAHGAHDVVVIRDVTELRRLESEVRQLRRIESVGHITASVVHDFNNLLTPIVCLSGLLQKGLEGDERLGEFARDVRSASERAAGLVRQVLSFTRRAPCRPQRVHIGSAIAELRPLIERVAGPGIALELALEDDAADAVVDRDQMEHVLINLAANGRDAMPNGGRLAIRTANVDLDDEGARSIEGSARGSYVVITVSDTGVGMTSEVRERIFERFFTTKAEGEGTGLGLATARRFVGESGGCIAVHSEPGRGTTVALYLPRAEAPGITSSQPSIYVDPPRGSEGVLVVDDDAAVRGAIRAVLEELGYAVREAACIDEAIACASDRGKAIDLLVVDVVLGSASGREVARRVTAMHRDAKVLFTSGHTARVLERHGIREDDPSLLRKAFTPSALARKVREVLDRDVRRPAVVG